MYSINVKVENNKVKIMDKDFPVTEHSLNAIKCVFDLPEEYEGLTCVAVYMTKKQNFKCAIIENEAILPFDALEEDERVTLGVYAIRGEEIIYSPKPVGFVVTAGSFVTEAVINFTEDDLDIYLEKANEMYQKVKFEGEEKIATITELGDRYVQEITDLSNSTKQTFENDVEEINTLKTDTINEVTTIKDTAIEKIETDKNAAIKAIEDKTQEEVNTLDETTMNYFKSIKWNIKPEDGKLYAVLPDKEGE